MKTEDDQGALQLVTTQLTADCTMDLTIHVFTLHSLSATCKQCTAMTCLISYIV